MITRRSALGAIGLCVVFAATTRGALAQELDRSKRPVPPPARPFALPPVTQRTLANGLRVEIVENHELPIVAVRVALSADSTFDPPGKEGLASITSAMLREGTTHADIAQLVQRMSTLGDSVTPGGFTTTTPHFERAIGLLADMLLHPSFPDSALARVIAAKAAAARQQQAVPAFIARNLFFRLLYGSEHPFFRLPSDSSIRSITRDDVVRFYGDYVRPQNATLVIVGDVVPATLMPALTRAFGEWPRGGATAGPHMQPTRGEQPTTIYLADAPGGSQATIFIGQMGPPRSSPEFFALQTANFVFGALPGSRLWQNVRERHGFAYNVGSGSIWRRAPEPSTIRGSASVNSTKTDSALAAWMDELRAMRGTRPPTDEELQRARMSQIGSLPIQLETVDQMATALAQLAIAGEATDFYGRLVARVSALTGADVTAAAKNYYDPDHLVIVVVGDRKLIEPGLRAANIAPIVVVDATGKPIP